jgi:hypothetical protein
VNRRITLLASAAAVALLLLGSTADAAPRHKRLKSAVLPAPKLPPEVTKQIKKVFPKGKITGSWQEEKGEIEVFVSFPTGRPIEVVFQKRGEKYQLTGYEFAVANDSLPPLANATLMGKYPGAKPLEVEQVFSPTWVLLGYQVTVAGKPELFIKTGGGIGKDPL